MIVIPCMSGRVEGLLTAHRQSGYWGSVYPAVWSFMLAARERGLGTALTTMHLVFEEECAEILGIPHDAYTQASRPSTGAYDRRHVPSRRPGRRPVPELERMGRGGDRLSGDDDVLQPPAAAEFAQRRARALETACDAGFDGMLVWSRGATNADGNGGCLYLANHQTPCSHLADFPGSSARGYCAIVLVPDRESVLVTDYFELEQDLVQIDAVRFSTDVAGTVGDVLAEGGLAGKRIAVDGAGTFLLASNELAALERAGAGTTLVFKDEILRDMRAVKSPAEIELMRAAQRIGCAWMQACLDVVEPGATEAT